MTQLKGHVKSRGSKNTGTLFTYEQESRSCKYVYKCTSWERMMHFMPTLNDLQ